MVNKGRLMQVRDKERLLTSAKVTSNIFCHNLCWWPPALRWLQFRTYLAQGLRWRCDSGAVGLSLAYRAQSATRFVAFMASQPWRAAERGKLKFAWRSVLEGWTCQQSAAISPSCSLLSRRFARALFSCFHFTPAAAAADSNRHRGPSRSKRLKGREGGREKPTALVWCGLGSPARQPQWAPSAAAAFHMAEQTQTGVPSPHPAPACRSSLPKPPTKSSNLEKGSLSCSFAHWAKAGLGGQ